MSVLHDILSVGGLLLLRYIWALPRIAIEAGADTRVEGETIPPSNARNEKINK